MPGLVQYNASTSGRGRGENSARKNASRKRRILSQTDKKNRTSRDS